MKVLVIFCFVALSVAILTPSKVILADNKLSKRVDGQYIVVFHPNTTAERRNAHIEGYGSKVFHTYEIGDSFFGYAAKFTQQDLVAAAQKAEVKYIEEDKLMHAVADSCVKQTGATWGIDRIAEKAINLDENYVYTSSAGSGVDAYVIDTGILTTHKDFEGRAKFGINTVGDGNKEDCNGHGTHVAGTIGSLTYGVAKKTTLIAVKVLGCNGSGTNTGVIAGINWVTDQYKNTKKPSVANMSLGGSKSQATNDAVASAVKAGVTMVVAAGNENQDACNVSPASEPVAITVGATDIGDSGSDQVDVRSSFSNYGTCVKILAPGSLITSLWIGSSNTATRTISGTSMASPHIAGSAALFLGNNPTATPTEVKDHLVSTASTGIVNLLCSSGSSCSRTPNKFVYNHCD